ncbi:MAG: helix-turn-helix domain-containing protein [Acidimicrobiia bacterium]
MTAPVPLQHGRAIRAIRNLKRLSVAEVAGAIGAHPQTLRNLELEKRSASEELLVKIAWALDVDPCVIMRDPPAVGEVTPWTRFLAGTAFPARGAA